MKQEFFLVEDKVLKECLTFFELHYKYIFKAQLPFDKDCKKIETSRLEYYKAEFETQKSKIEAEMQFDSYAVQYTDIKPQTITNKMEYVINKLQQLTKENITTELIIVL